MISRFSSWINTVNTTALRIIVSIGLAVEIVNLVAIAMLFFRWEATSTQYKILTGIGVGILTMMGLDVWQFIAKRKTDAEYVTAKQGPSPVNVEAPSTVEVRQDAAGSPPASTTVVTPPQAPIAAPDTTPALRRDD